MSNCNKLPNFDSTYLPLVLLCKPFILQFGIRQPILYPPNISGIGSGKVLNMYFHFVSWAGFHSMIHYASQSEMWKKYKDVCFLSNLQCQIEYQVNAWEISFKLIMHNSLHASKKIVYPLRLKNEYDSQSENEIGFSITFTFILYNYGSTTAHSYLYLFLNIEYIKFFADSLRWNQWTVWNGNMQLWQRCYFRFGWTSSAFRMPLLESRLFRDTGQLDITQHGKTYRYAMIYDCFYLNSHR